MISCYSAHSSWKKVRSIKGEKKHGLNSEGTEAKFRWFALVITKLDLTEMSSTTSGGCHSSESQSHRLAEAGRALWVNLPSAAPAETLRAECPAPRPGGFWGSTWRKLHNFWATCASAAAPAQKCFPVLRQHLLFSIPDKGRRKKKFCRAAQKACRTPALARVTTPKYQSEIRALFSAVSPGRPAVKAPVPGWVCKVAPGALLAASWHALFSRDGEETNFCCRREG